MGSGEEVGPILAIHREYKLLIHHGKHQFADKMSTVRKDGHLYASAQNLNFLAQCRYLLTKLRIVHKQLVDILG